MPTLPDEATLRRLARHPVVWSLPFNSGYYEYWINFDPQGEGQRQEWVQTRRIFRYTSGVLCGQLLALVVGVALSRRYRQAVALAVGVLLAGVTALVAFPWPRAWRPPGSPSRRSTIRS